jgi:hypothetical protein
MKYAIEMDLRGMIFIRRFVTNESGIQLILRLLHHKFQSLPCWHYGPGKKFMKYSAEMASDGMIYKV